MCAVYVAPRVISFVINQFVMLFWAYAKHKHGASSFYPKTMSDGKTYSSDTNEISEIFASYVLSTYGVNTAWLEIV